MGYRVARDLFTPVSNGVGGCPSIEGTYIAGWGIGWQEICLPEWGVQRSSSVMYVLINLLKNMIELK